MGTTSCAVHTALLLAGATKTAELAVLDELTLAETSRSVVCCLKPCGLRSGGEPNRRLYQTGSACFPLNFDAFCACSQGLGTALFLEF